MKKILVPTDISSRAANAVDFAVQSAKLLPAEINLLHAFERKGSTYSDYLGVNHQHSRLVLNHTHNKPEQLHNSMDENVCKIVSVVFN